MGRCFSRGLEDDTGIGTGFDFEAADHIADFGRDASVDIKMARKIAHGHIHAALSVYGAAVGYYQRGVAAAAGIYMTIALAKLEAKPVFFADDLGAVVTSDFHVFTRIDKHLFAGRQGHTEVFAATALASRFPVHIAIVGHHVDAAARGEVNLTAAISHSELARATMVSRMDSGINASREAGIDVAARVDADVAGMSVCID